MIDDMMIDDAVAHPWNIIPEYRNSASQAQIDGVYASHKLFLARQTLDA